MRKPYKRLDKKEDLRKCFQKGLLHVAEERVLCRQLGSCGFLSGNHIYIVRRLFRCTEHSINKETEMEGQYETFVTILGALGKLVVAASIVERGLAFIFEHKWFIGLLMKESTDPADATKTVIKSKVPGLKGLIALACSIGISFGYGFDILHVLFGTSKADSIGMLITGFVIAGGSAGAIAIFQGYLNISKDSRDAIIAARKAEAESAKEVAQLAVFEAKAKKEKAEAESAKEVAQLAALEAKAKKENAEAESAKEVAQLAVFEAKAKKEKAEAEREEALLRKKTAESKAPP
jgi:hypothetical protein